MRGVHVSNTSLLILISSKLTSIDINDISLVGFDENDSIFVINKQAYVIRATQSTLLANACIWIEMQETVIDTFFASIMAPKLTLGLTLYSL